KSYCEIPDSLKGEAAKWVTETVRACDQHLSGGDIEDQEEVINTASKRADKFYERERRVDGLEIKEGEHDYYVFIEEGYLTYDQRLIYDSLKTAAIERLEGYLKA